MPLPLSTDKSTFMEAWNAAAQALVDRCEPPHTASLLTMHRPGFIPRGFRITERGPQAVGKQELLIVASDLFVIAQQMERREQQGYVREGDGLIEFQFRLSGSAVRELGGKKIVVPEGTLLIYRAPRGTRVHETTQGRGREDVVSVFCNHSYLYRHFGDFVRSLRPTLAATLQNPASELCMRITLYPRLAKLARQILFSHFTTSKRLVYAEGHLLLICCEVLAVLENEQVDCRKCVQLSDQDFSKLHAARELLIARHTPPPSIALIAREIGLGTTKLKEGFRTLFGKSVFAYGQELRMNLARDLLKQPDQSIQRTASLVGYEYQHSFTVAFRRHFGLLPKVYRRTPSADRSSGRLADGAADDAFGFVYGAEARARRTNHCMPEEPGPGRW